MTSSRPDSGVSVSISPLNQTEQGLMTSELGQIAMEPEIVSVQQQIRSRVRSSSSGSSEDAISTKPSAASNVAKRRRPKRAKKSETKALPIPIKDSKSILQQELDVELAEISKKLSLLERQFEEQEVGLDDMVSKCELVQRAEMRSPK